MPENNSFISIEMAAAIAGALVTFVLAILWQYFTDKRNRTQLTYSRKTDSPLSIPRSELKEKLKIYYDHNEINNIFYARLAIKNTGQKTIKKQIFSCEFDKDCKSIDQKFPLVTTSPEKEILVEKILNENQNDSHSNIYRYQIDALAPGQGIQVDFLFDGNQKDPEVAFRPNQLDEVKIIEGDSSSDPNLEFYIVQFGLNFLTVIVLLFTANMLGLLGLLVIPVSIPFLYSAFVSFRKLVPLLLDRSLNNNEQSGYQITVGNSSQSNVMFGNGTIKMIPESVEEENRKTKAQSIALVGNGKIITTKEKSFINTEHGEVEVVTSDGKLKTKKKKHKK